MGNAYTVVGITVVAATGVDCLTDLAVSVPPNLALAPVVHVPPDNLGLANGHGVATAVVREARINWAAVGTGVPGFAWARVAKAAEAGDAVGVLRARGRVGAVIANLTSDAVSFVVGATHALVADLLVNALGIGAALVSARQTLVDWTDNQTTEGGHPRSPLSDCGRRAPGENMGDDLIDTSSELLNGGDVVEVDQVTRKSTDIRRTH